MLHLCQFGNDAFSSRLIPCISHFQVVPNDFSVGWVATLATGDPRATTGASRELIAGGRARTAWADGDRQLHGNRAPLRPLTARHLPAGETHSRSSKPLFWPPETSRWLISARGCFEGGQLRSRMTIPWVGRPPLASRRLRTLSNQSQRRPCSRKHPAASSDAMMLALRRPS